MEEGISSRCGQWRVLAWSACSSLVRPSPRGPCLIRLLMPEGCASFSNASRAQTSMCLCRSVGPAAPTPYWMPSPIPAMCTIGRQKGKSCALCGTSPNIPQHELTKKCITFVELQRLLLHVRGLFQTGSPFSTGGAFFEACESKYSCLSLTRVGLLQCISLAEVDFYKLYLDRLAESQNYIIRQQ